MQDGPRDDHQLPPVALGNGPVFMPKQNGGRLLRRVVEMLTQAHTFWVLAVPGSAHTPPDGGAFQGVLANVDTSKQELGPGLVSDLRTGFHGVEVVKGRHFGIGWRSGVRAGRVEVRHLPWAALFVTPQRQADPATIMTNDFPRAASIGAVEPDLGTVRP